MTRIIKLQPQYRRKSKWDKSFRMVPKLTLSGDWLLEAGFQPSKHIKVEVQNNRLVITSVE